MAPRGLRITNEEAWTDVVLSDDKDFSDKSALLRVSNVQQKRVVHREDESLARLLTLLLAQDCVVARVNINDEDDGDPIEYRVVV